MITLLTALAVLGGCTVARWYLERPGRRTETTAWGHVELTALWNHGGAFDLPAGQKTLASLSALALGTLWTQRRRSRLGTGLVLGGGLSNLWERVRHGRVYDYVRFPKAPGALKRYVFNLADFAIFAGAIALLLGSGKRRKR